MPAFPTTIKKDALGSIWNSRGVDKKDISLEMRRDSFCISAPRGEDKEYSSCFSLAHEVLPEKAEAKYESGLLRIFVPIKEWDHRVNVTVQ